MVDRIEVLRKILKKRTETRIGTLHENLEQREGRVVCERT